MLWLGALAPSGWPGAPFIPFAGGGPDLVGPPRRKLALGERAGRAVPSGNMRSNDVIYHICISHIYIYIYLDPETMSFFPSRQKT